MFWVHKLYIKGTRIYYKFTDKNPDTDRDEWCISSIDIKTGDWRIDEFFGDWFDSDMYKRHVWKVMTNMYKTSEYPEETMHAWY